MANCKVFVGSLPLGTKPKELRHLFQNYGIVIECDVLNRCGFIHMETSDMAETAILALHGSEFKGQMIVVEPGRQKEEQNPKKNLVGAPPTNILCDVDTELNDLVPRQNEFDSLNARGGLRDRSFSRGGGRGSGPNRGVANRGNMPHRGGGNPFGMSNRGGMGFRGGMESSYGIQNRSGMSNSGMQNRRGIGSESDMPMRGSFNPRGGMNSNRDVQNNRTEDDIGPMRNNSNFKQRTTPYTAGILGDPFRGGKFSGNQRGGGNSNRQNTRFNNNTQQHENWNNRRDSGNKPHRPTQGEANLIDDQNSRRSYNNAGGNFRGGRGNFIPPNNMGQDRRGFTLDNPQPFGGPSRSPSDRNAYRNTDQRFSGGFQGRSHGNSRGGPQRGGSFGRGRGGGGRNFTTPAGQDTSYNTEFPALAPSRGRGGFSGTRGGFNRNASHPRQNMMPNRR